MEEKLIEFVKKNNFLFDKRHRNYKNIYLRDKAFEELSNEVNVPAKRLKERWKTLRDRFYKEIKNDNLSSDQMIFLKDVVIANANISGDFPTASFMSDIPHISSDSFEPQYPCTPTSAEALFFSSDDLSTPAKKKQEKLEEIIGDMKKQISNVVTMATEVFAVPAVPKTASQHFFDSLAQQTDDAKLSAIEFAHLQMEILSVFNKVLEEKQQKK